MYQKIIIFCTDYIPIQIIPDIVIGEDINLVIDELINIKDCEKSDIETETFDKTEEINYPQDYENNSTYILDDLNERDINNDKIQATFKRGRLNKLSIFINSQDYYELPQRTIRANGNIYHIFKPNSFRVFQNLYQDKASMEMILNKFKYLTSTCWKKKSTSYNRYD